MAHDDLQALEDALSPHDVAVLRREKNWDDVEEALHWKRSLEDISRLPDYFDAFATDRARKETGRGRISTEAPMHEVDRARLKHIDRLDRRMKRMNEGDTTISTPFKRGSRNAMYQIAIRLLAEVDDYRDQLTGQWIRQARGALDILVDGDD